MKKKRREIKYKNKLSLQESHTVPKPRLREPAGPSRSHTGGPRTEQNWHFWFSAVGILCEQVLNNFPQGDCSIFKPLYNARMFFLSLRQNLPLDFTPGPGSASHRGQPLTLPAQGGLWLQGAVDEPLSL